MLVPGRITRKNLLKEMNVEDFTHMSTDKVLTLVNNLPYMDREVALKALSEFPNFVELEKEVISLMKENLNKVFDKNDASTFALYDSCQRTLDYCFNRLSSENISAEERAQLEKLIMDVNQMMYDKDTENKEFLLKALRYALATAGGIVIGAAALLGASAQLKLPDSATDSDDDNNIVYES